MTLITQALAKIAEMEERAEGATRLLFKGTWQGWRADIPHGRYTYECLCPDMSFDAHSRTDLPALCALVKLLVERIPAEWIEAPPEYKAALKAFVEAK
jgi:hypothetical protein